MFPYHYALVIMCSVGEVIFFEHGCYISALGHVRMLNIKQLCSSRPVFRDLV